MRTQDIQSISELRGHLSEHFERLQQTGRPLFVTKEGKTAAVVLSPATYDALMDQAEFSENLLLVDRGLQDVKAGRVREARSGIREFAVRHNIPVSR